MELNYSDKNRGLIFPEEGIKLAEFFGIMAGDGFLGHYPNRNTYSLGIFGNKIKDKDFIENFVAGLIQDLFNLTPKLRERKENNTLELLLNSKGMVFFLHSKGFPLGKKGGIEIPRWIKEDLSFFSSFIRGFFDTDGYLCFKNKEGKKYPVLGLSSISRNLLFDIKIFLESKGISSYLGKRIPKKGKEQFKLQISGKRNIHLFFKEVGSSNKRNSKKYLRMDNMGRLGVEPRTPRSSV
jgi:intein/homing endonuclease